MPPIYPLDTISADINTTAIFPTDGSFNIEIIQYDGYVDGITTTPTDTDWFRMTLDAGEWVRVHAADLGAEVAQNVDTYLRLYDAEGNLLEENKEIRFQGDGGRLYFGAAEDNTVFYIEVGAEPQVFVSDDNNVGQYYYQAFMAEAEPVINSILWGTQQPDNIVTVYFVPQGESRTIDVGETYTSEGFNAYEIAQFQQAFDRISEVVDLEFQIVTGAAAGANADFQMVLDTNEVLGSFLGFFNPPGETFEGTAVFDGSSWDRSAGGDLALGGFGFVTIMHEILHGLGLAHPHDNGGTSSIMLGVDAEFDDFGFANMNQGIFTTMSYNSGYQTGSAGSQPAFNGNYGNEAGPMALDIAALQSMYGTVARNTGNTTYMLPDQNAAGTMWRSIWDTAGADELRYDGSRDVTIRLREATLVQGEAAGGYISAAEGIAGGYTIANGVQIEIATGGFGDDFLEGSGYDNLLRARAGDDRLAGLSGDDILQGGSGNDRMYGGNQDDDLYGGDDRDTMYGGNNDDTVYGEDGGDWVYGDDGDDALYGGASTDRMSGGGNNDLMYGGASGDYVNGNAGTDTMNGDGGRDRMSGGGNSDYIYGGQDNDVISGDGGYDYMRGGGGADIFDFNSTAESSFGAGRYNRDRIFDFTSGVDRLDLRTIDADVTASGNQVFDYRGFDDFTDAGQVRITRSGSDIVIQMNTDNNLNTIEAEILLLNQDVLRVGDFLL